MMNLFDEICGKVAPGLCRLSAGGGIAVKTRSGYRTYDQCGCGYHVCPPDHRGECEKCMDQRRTGFQVQCRRPRME